MCSTAKCSAILSRNPPSLDARNEGNAPASVGGRWGIFFLQGQKYPPAHPARKRYISDYYPSPSCNSLGTVIFYSSRSTGNAETVSPCQKRISTGPRF